MRHLGWPIAPEKIEGPARSLTFLGICIDLDAQLILLDPAKLAAVTALAQDWLTKKQCSYADIDSLAGSLFWTTRVVRGGRTFLRRVVDAKKKRPHRGTLPVEPDIREDIRWWVSFLTAFNGRALIPESDWTANSSTWTLSTDASGSGFGARWNNRFLCGTWSPSQLAQVQRQKGIAISTLELAAIVIAAKSWGQHWRSRKILVQCDNEPSVTTINAESCTDPLMMMLTREL